MDAYDLVHPFFWLKGAEEDEPNKPKRMVIMVGPPAAGKGFFLGEPEADVPGSKFGWKLPSSTHGLFKDQDIPDAPEHDESDNHLRAIQFEESKKHYNVLASAHKKGKEAFRKALSNIWYDTKDGGRTQLKSMVSYDSFPENHSGFFKKTNKDFYVSMRGWHDDAKKHNSVTGKPKERYKDEARHRFDDAINKKIDKDNELLIVDSAGEDIDAQDYKGQIDNAKANGYDVTVVFLHPEQADTELSNLARGKVAGKRMVDQADIDNWYKNNKAALEEIQKASPQNFLHYRKAPPDPDPKKAAEMRKQARDLMNNLPPVPAKQEGESDDDFKARSKKWKEDNKKSLDTVMHTLYKAGPYSKDPVPETSYGSTLSSETLPKKPKGNIAEAVHKMNEDADARAGKGKEEEGAGKSKEPAKDEGSHTQQQFLREMGDKEVPNPNPDGRKPRIKVRSLPWEQQKRYYQKWVKQRKDKHANMAFRVAAAYLERGRKE